MPLNVTPLDRLGNAIAAQETVEQIEASAFVPDLAVIADIARSKGHLGFMVIRSGGRATPFIGAFLGYDGEPKERTFAEHATPEAALAALAK